MDTSGMARATNPINARLALGGLLCLLLGTAVYVAVRPTPVWFLPAALHFPDALPGPGWAMQAFPTFAHTAAFALLTAGVLGGTRRQAWIACCVWVAINSAFEIGQHPWVSQPLAAWLPRWFDHVWLLDQARGYFVNGTFDSADILAAILGGAAAWAVISVASSRGGPR
jgi:hypothetical protein